MSDGAAEQFNIHDAKTNLSRIRSGRSSGATILPSACLMAISQIVAALTRTSGSWSSRSLISSGNSGASASHQSTTWVSSSKLTASCRNRRRWTR